MTLKVSGRKMTRERYSIVYCIRQSEFIDRPPTLNPDLAVLQNKIPSRAKRGNIFCPFFI